MSQGVPQVSKRLSLVLAVVIVFLLGWAFTPLKTCLQAQSFQCDAQSERNDESITELAPRYYAYNTATLDLAQNQGKVVLYFWAPWCSSCSSVDLDLVDHKVFVPEGITVLRIPYDSAKELRREYNVVTQHTFVQIDQNGTMLNQWVGGDVSDFALHLK